MRKFEYKIITANTMAIRLDELQDTLNKYGLQGWELVTNIDLGYKRVVHLIFKREINLNDQLIRHRIPADDR